MTATPKLPDNFRKYDKIPPAITNMPTRTIPSPNEPAFARKREPASTWFRDKSCSMVGISGEKITLAIEFRKK
jgi:hypothetical protein